MCAKNLRKKLAVLGVKMLKGRMMSLFALVFKSRLMLDKSARGGGGGGNAMGMNMRGIISVVVYIALLPMIIELLDSLSGSLTGTGATMLGAILPILPAVLVFQVLGKLKF